MGLYVIGITGASGTIYAKSLLLELLCMNHDIDLIISRAGLIVANEELGWQIPENEVQASVYFRDLFHDLARKDKRLAGRKMGRINYYHDDHIAAPPASGSYLSDGMIIVPCSMGATSGVASARSATLLERAADVALKEHRRLVIIPRESPMNAIHLRNLLTLAQLGVHVVPACPSFYQHPRSLDDMVGYFTLRTLDQVGIHQESDQRWSPSTIT